MALKTAANMALSGSASLSQGYASGGSINSAHSNNESWSQSNSGTDAMSAREWSAMQAELAWQRDMEAYQMQMAFNSEEAQKQRDWQEMMANTIYTRSVKNMREAGINPILAANMGLSGAAVGSGATANIGGAPSAPLAQNFMDSWSASNAYGYGQSESYGSSWNQSENGLITALSALGSIIGDAINHATSGANINIALEGLNNWRETQREQTKEAVKNKDYSSPSYPHEPGRPGSTEANMKILDKIVNFANGIGEKLGLSK